MGLRKHLRMKHIFTRRNFAYLLIVLAIILLCGSFGYKQYRKWSSSRLTVQGREYMGKGDFTNAVLCLRRAAETNPKNMDAFRLMAELAEAAGSPQALDWYAQIVSQNPSLDNRLAMARCALRLGNREAATSVLNEVPADQRNNAAYYKCAGALAWTFKEPALAASCFEKALGFAPNDIAIRYDLASIQIHANDTNIVREARQSLAMCRTNGAVRPEALRLLVWDSERQGALKEAAIYAEELLKEPKAVFNDKLLHLGVLNKSSNAILKSTISALQIEASTNLQNAFQLGEWMKNNQRSADAIEWILAMPQAIQTNLPMAILLAECRASAAQWKLLIQTTEKQNWNDQEFLRHAILAKAQIKLGDKKQFQEHWQQAISATRTQIEPLAQLLRFAAKESWTNQNKEVLWAITTNHPKEKWAIQALQEHYYLQGETRELHKLFSRLSELDPNDLRTKNNLAMTGLLLDPKSNTWYALARECMSQNATNGLYISTFAYALHVRNQTAEAIQLLEKLDPKQMDNPSVGITYGIILGSTGNAKAKKYLALADKQRLLPEIATLVQQAKQKVK